MNETRIYLVSTDKGSIKDKNTGEVTQWTGNRLVCGDVSNNEHRTYIVKASPDFPVSEVQKKIREKGYLVCTLLYDRFGRAADITEK